MSTNPIRPAHLDPSELGTKEYWDRYYQNDLDNESDNGSDEDGGEEKDETTAAGLPEPSELESWFDDVGAPEKTLAFLTSTTFPLSPNYSYSSATESPTETSVPNLPTVLDLGTGNGSALFALRLEGGYAGRMVGVDYSTQSIELARKLWRQYSASLASSSDPSSSSPSAATPDPASTSARGEDITFKVLDLINDTPNEQLWWPTDSGGFDLVLDKGTFDAISLSSATVVESIPASDSPEASTRERRVYELYPTKVLAMVKPGGFLLVTSCNWTEEEVIAWFSGTANPQNEESEGRFEVYDTIKYPVFEFGGQKGQGVASVCFRKAI